MEPGPVEYMIVAFPGNKFRGEIAPALEELVSSGTIRIMDLAFIGKSEDGEAVAFEIADLDPEVRSALETLEIDATGLISEDDLQAAAEELEPGNSAAFLLWEDLWAAKLAKAMRDAGGVLIDIQHVPHEFVTEAREYIREAAEAAAAT